MRRHRAFASPRVSAHKSLVMRVLSCVGFLLFVRSGFLAAETDNRGSERTVATESSEKELESPDDRGQTRATVLQSQRRQQRRRKITVRLVLPGDSRIPSATSIQALELDSPEPAGLASTEAENTSTSQVEQHDAPGPVVGEPVDAGGGPGTDIVLEAPEVGRDIGDATSPVEAELATGSTPQLPVRWQTRSGHPHEHAAGVGRPCGRAGLGARRCGE